MDYFGINSPEDMPKIREVLADQVIQPTLINPADFEEPSALVVTDDGELVIAEEETDQQINEKRETGSEEGETGGDEQGTPNNDEETPGT